MAFQNLTKNERDAVTLFSRRVKDLLRKNLVSVKLFGSKIRGDFSAHSDIDILLVVKEKNYSLREQIYDILLQIDLE